MAKGAADQEQLGGLHRALTRVFTKVLQKYEVELDFVIPETMGDDMVDELALEGITINPAMLTAVSKFLKDNEIMFDTEEMDQLGSLERRLKDKKAKRDNVINLANLPRVEHG